MQGKIVKTDYLGGKLKAVILLSEEDEVLDKVVKLKDKDINVEIKQIRQKRSLEANSYAWVLIGKIADVLKSSKDEIYLQMLIKYGQHIVVTLKTGTSIGRVFKYFEKFKDGLSNGKEYTAWRVFIGSSQYDSNEMSNFIEGIISEAKELGIDTLTPSQISELEGIR